uniref:Myosin motor domain-containing protein n=1 Tax=Glycine max TaxID=3847 RepID=A0A0R0EEF5_SOYBN
MEVVGINSDEQDAIFRIVAAVLHLGNIEFVKGGEDETDSSQPKDEKSHFHLKIAAELLMCDEKSLEDSFCKRVMVTRGDTITKSLDPNAAALSRDALAKIVYSRLFDWIVDKINNSIGQDPDSTNLIGVLDIYGFESFKTNSFEQFCINLTNEKLQQHFNQHVFKMEQEEYTKEEIDWSYIEFVDNQDVLDLIEKKPGGIIALLDEACMFPRSTHETFAEKLYQTFKDNKRFSKPKLSRTDFTINHYAGDVTYQTDFFLDKNKDYVVPEHAALLSNSKCPFVSGLFPPLPEETTKSTKFSSIATQFKLQLQSLLETLNATEPHYIRCVKPNNLLKPGMFENNNVLQQLRWNGVMEAIRISCAGYPTRKNFDEFVQRFTILEPNVLKACPDEMTACKRLLDRANLKDYQIGKTKVFLRAGQMAELDACRAEVLGRSASIIQRKVRTFICRKHYILLQLSAIELQRVARGQLARHQYECMRREAASLIIQKNFRMHISRNAYKTIYAPAIYIQTGMRGMAARNDLRFRKRTQAAIVIQGHYRGYSARTYFKKLKKSAIAAQCSWRRTLARRELRKLKMAAKESKALEAAKNNLEIQVKELTSCLETEKRMRLQEIEEAKKQENEKLQHALQEMELQFQETKAALIQEREAAKKVAEQTPTTQENPVNVVDSELINKLTTENEQLKDQVNSLERKIDEAERKYEECNRVSEERMNQIIETESKMIETKTNMQRLEEKLSDMETENQVLRQQALLSSSSRRMSGKLAPATTPESVDALFKCVTKDLGFSEGKPVAAFTLYNCLLHWKSFEAEKTSIFDRLIQLIGSELEDPDNNDCMAYWLSNTSSLFFHLQRCLRVPTTRKPPTPTSFFGRMTQGFRSSNSLSSNAFDVEHQVDAKYPALLFKQQLAAYVEKIYGIIRESFKKDLSPPLSSCTKVPPVLVQKLFSQIFQYINMKLFNSLLLHRECCTSKSGEQIRSGLAELELWCTEATEEYVGSSFNELKHAKQAVRFLVALKKEELSYDDLTNDLCPVLSAQQLYRICTLYSDDDDDNKQSVSTDVTTRLKLLMTDDADEDDKSFLLEDNTSHPIIVEEISTSALDKTIPKIKPPAELLENANFQFLHDYC